MCDIVVDCTPKRVGARNAEGYRTVGKRFILHGGEHETTGHSFAAEANYASAVGRDSTHVVSCNTTSISMVMGERGMADMAEMEMPLPDNTAPMMTGPGPFGSMEMGGMFTVLKVQRDQKRGDYSNPEWFSHPQGTLAYEFHGELPAAARAPGSAPLGQQGRRAPGKDVEVQIRKPSGHSGH